MSLITVLTVVAFFAGVCSASPASRIVNGTPTTVAAYPSIVQLDFYNPKTSTWSHNCGGNILNQLYILSAARCTDVRNDPHYSVNHRRVRAGATYRNTGGVISPVASALNHPDYNVLTFLDADITIIRLGQLLVFNNEISSISIMPQGFEIPNNAPVTLAGWGSVGDGSAAEDLLFINLVHKSNCDNLPPIFLTNYKICSGSPTNAIGGACGGDFGGPMYYSGILAGVVSWGPTDCHTDVPTISAKVASFTGWILDNTP